MDYVRVGAFQPPDNLRYEALTMGEIARHRKGDVVDVLLDLLVEEDLALNEVQRGPAGTAIATFLKSPYSMVGPTRWYSAKSRARGHMGRSHESSESSCASWAS